MKLTLPLTLIAILPLTLQAEEAPLETHTEMSYISTSGNTKTESFALDFAAKKNIDKHALQAELNGLYGTQDDIENKNKFNGEFNYDYGFSKHFKVNYILSYKDDKFSGYDYQWFTGPGLKYVALSSDEHNLFFQLNVLYATDKEGKKYYTDATMSTEIAYPYADGLEGAYLDPDSHQLEHSGNTRLKMEYKWQITDSLKFIEKADYRNNWDDSGKYYINSKTALESKMSDIFSMGVSYTANYTNQPPAGVEHCDKTFMISLIADY